MTPTPKGGPLHARGYPPSPSQLRRRRCGRSARLLAAAAGTRPRRRRGTPPRTHNRRQARGRPHAGEPLVRSLLRHARRRARVRRPERADPAQPLHTSTASRSSTSTTRRTRTRRPTTCCPGTSTRRPPARRRSLRPRTPGPSSTRRSTSRSGTAGQPTAASTTSGSRLTSAADGATNGLYTMSYYERQDIPFHFALAETFTLCDAYHCSLLGPTWPNRMYLMTGMIDPEGTGGGPVTTNVVPSPFTGKPYTWTTYPERLTESRDQLARLPGGGRLRHQPARVVRELPGREARQPAVRERADDLPARPVRVGREARQAPDRLVDPPDLGPERAPGVPSGVRRELPRLEAQRGRREPGPLVEDRIHRQLRRERWAVRPRRSAASAGGDARRVRPGRADRRTGRSAAASACRRSSISPWSVGGYVATEQFDHTSVLQFLEKLTGVRRDEHHAMAPPDVRRPHLRARLLERQAKHLPADPPEHDRRVLGGRE